MPTPTPGRTAAGLAAAVATALTVTACTPGASTTPTGTVTSTRTITAAPSTIVPVVPKPFAPAALVAPAQPPGSTLPAGQTDATCPYIKAGLNVEPESTGTNFAALEGSRVQRVTVLTTLKPVGCRFYWFDDFHPTGDIMPSTYATATEAHNAMVVTSEAGTSAMGVPSFVPGVDGVSFRTNLNGPDQGQNWAFAFAKGTVMVVIRTDQTDTSFNARSIAEAIVGQF